MSLSSFAFFFQAAFCNCRIQENFVCYTSHKQKLQTFLLEGTSYCGSPESHVRGLKL